jgi:8-oxo-dGTP pyrophosphatase MutT (NUDIX family)
METRLLPADATGVEAPHSDFDLVGDRPAGVALREAAVLMALVRRPAGLTLILTQRTADMPTHAGQIALPGGRRQPEDASLASTALREAQEEVGLDPALVRVLGASDAYQTVTGYRVTPIIGLVEATPTLTPDPREVADVFEAPFAFFMNPANHQRHHRDWQGLTRHYHAMPWNDRYVWGATAGMLLGLSTRLTAGD